MTGIRIAPLALLALLALVPPLEVRADQKSEREARALFKEGNRLFAEKEYAAALDMFKAAYSRWPNPKILLNIGTTLRHLGRDAEAADAYDKFLAEGRPDPKRKAEVEAILKELGSRLGKLRIEVNEPGAKVLVDGKLVGESPQAITLRVDAGTHTVVAEKQGYPAAAATVQISAGQERVVELRLVQGGPASPGGFSPGPTPGPSPGAVSPPGAGTAAVSPGEPGRQPGTRAGTPGAGTPGAEPMGKGPGGAAAPQVAVAPAGAGGTHAPAAAGTAHASAAPTAGVPGEPSGQVRAEAPKPATESGRFLAFARCDADGKFRGAAGTVGVGYAPLAWLDVWAAGILGPTFGFEAGATVTFLRGAFRPSLLLGVPVFFSDGARPGVHAAAGLEWRFSRHLGAILLVGAEYFPTAQTTPDVKYEKFVFVPSLGLLGRL